MSAHNDNEIDTIQCMCVHNERYDRTTWIYV
jgi:hypothetical protein